MQEVETSPDSKEDQEETEMIDMENTVRYKKEDILKSPTVTKLFIDDATEITEKEAKKAPNTFVSNQYNVDSAFVEEEFEKQKQGSGICDRIVLNNEIIVGNVVESHEDKVNILTEPDDSLLNLVNPSSTTPVITGTLILAAQDMTTTLSDALNTITSTPPTPPPRITPSVRTPLPPTPPSPMTRPLFNRDLVDQDQVDQLPSPSPEKDEGERMSELEENPPRPAPPSNVIKHLEKKIEIQYKKYPKLERIPPRPILPKAPLPPERSNSQGGLKSIGPSPQNTTTQKQKIIIRAVRTPSPSPVPFETTKLQVGTNFQN